MKHKIFYILILLFLFSISGFAQDKPSWITSIEKTFSQKETDWKIENKIERGEPGFFTESLTLKSGEYTASVEITSYDKITNPEETFNGLVTAFDDTMGKRKTKTKLEKFGDEGFIWSNSKEDDWTIIKFRKQKTFVYIFAPDGKIARRFAQYVIEQIP